MALKGQGAQRDLSATASVQLQESVAIAGAWNCEYSERVPVLAVIFPDLKHEYVHLE